MRNKNKSRTLGRDLLPRPKNRRIIFIRHLVRQGAKLISSLLPAAEYSKVGDKMRLSVIPAAFLAALLIPFTLFNTQNKINLFPERTITINDNGLYFNIKTNKKLASEILWDLELFLKPEDRVYPPLSEEAQTKIIIERAIPVFILADGKARPINTFEKTVEKILQEAQITLEAWDELNYRISYPPFSNMEIVITRVKFDTLTRNVSLPYKTIYQKDKDLASGQKKIERAGENGLKKQVYKIIYKDNKEYKRTLEKEEILKKPQDEIILEGTKVVVGKPYYGVASYYRYGNQLTCASTFFPQNSSLRVTNVHNGKEVIVKVNDYGPFISGRIIDLNIPAFEKIAPLGAGIVKVKVEKIIK